MKRSGLFSVQAPTLYWSALVMHTGSGEVLMSITVFLAFCILGCDFLLYVLFQWTYGEKHRKHARRTAARAEKRRSLSGNHAARVVQFPESAVQHRTGYF